MPAPERRLYINQTAHNLVPQRVLHVSEVWLDESVNVIRIEYTMTPPTPNPGPTTGHQSCMSWWQAVDDVGTTYTDCGGAYGLSNDGQSTQGVLSLQPLPPPEATSLTITLNPSFGSEIDAREWTFNVDLGPASG
jgi:hypothetical protein